MKPNKQIKATPTFDQFIAFLKGKMRNKERAVFIEWLENSEENIERFISVYDFVVGAGLLPEEEIGDNGKIWEKIKRNIDENENNL